MGEEDDIVEAGFPAGAGAAEMDHRFVLFKELFVARN